MPSSRRPRGYITLFRRFLLGVVLAACLAASPAWALLVMEVSVGASMAGGRVSLSAKVTNLGDEPALNLQARLLYPEAVRSAQVIKTLAAGHSHNFSLAFTPAKGGPGRRAAVLLIHYQDANQYPFSALAHAYYSYDKDLPGSLAVTTTPTALSDQGQTSVTIKNPLDTPVTVMARIFTPAELGAEPKVQELGIKARSQAEISYNLHNFSGLAGAHYPVLLLLEYAESGLSAAQTVTIMVSLTEHRNFFRRNIHWLLAAVGGLLLLFVWLYWREKRRPA